MNIEYIIDQQDMILAANMEWFTFYRENSDGSVANVFIGDHIYRWITGTEVQIIYAGLLRRLREFKTSITFPFRCDSPSQQRLMEMTMQLEAENSVRFKTHYLEVQERAPITTKAELASKMASLTLCAWCNRVRLGTEWMDLNMAVRELGLMEQPRLPPFTHGICPDCRRDALDGYRENGGGFKHTRLT